MLMIFLRLPKNFWFKNPSQKHMWIQHHPQTKRKKLPFDSNWVFHLNFLFKETAGRKFNQFLLNKIWSCRCHCANITMQKRLSTNNWPQGSRPHGLYRFHAQASCEPGCKPSRKKRRQRKRMATFTPKVHLWKLHHAPRGGIVARQRFNHKMEIL